MSQLTASKILARLLPHLRVAAAYASHVQSQIRQQPEKGGGLFTSVLTDADLSVQTFVEVLLLGYFPQVRFYGEEHAKSFNTRYFSSIEFGEPGDYLVTLDPIDGTRYYADGHRSYQIILNVLSGDVVEASLIIQPALHRYCYGLRGQGAYWGALEQSLDQCQPLAMAPKSQRIYLGGGAGHFGARVAAPYEPYDIYQVYSSTVPMPSMASLLDGAYAGAILGRAQVLDGVAIAFLAQEAGWIVTAHDGSPPPPLASCADYQLPGLLIAPTAAVHRDLLAIVTGGEQP